MVTAQSTAVTSSALIVAQNFQAMMKREKLSSTVERVYYPPVPAQKPIWSGNRFADEDHD
jgi:hypothetical protein